MSSPFAPNLPAAPRAAGSAAGPAGRTAPGREVLVVGTGVVGLAAALGCAQRGLAVTLVGPLPRPLPPAGQWDARIYAISPAARALLAQLRVWPQVDAGRVAPVRHMRIFGDRGAPLHFDALASGASELATICEEAQLLQALWLACSLCPGLRHIGRNVTALHTQDPVQGPAAWLRLDDGSEIAGDLLLAADGKRSPLRAAAGIGVRERPYGQSGVVANFTGARRHDQTAWQWFTPEGVVALLPLPGERVSLVWSAPSALATELMALPPEALAARVDERTGGLLGPLQALGQAHAFPLDRLVIERLVQPGMALLGDAAHALHPLAGQGLNLGLQDVSELLRQFDAREPWRALGDPVWLRRYARARAEPLLLMGAAVDGLDALFRAGGTPLAQVRNLGMRVLDRLAPVKHALIRHAMGQG
jgi:ubiquinone biosynthesis UbiH/UbiF/VisC/COQ6 family hydroxylase